MWSVVSQLRRWSARSFGNVQKQVKNLREDMERDERSNFVAHIGDQLRQMKIDMSELLDREELMWKQRAKVQWLAEGDKNTKYFHAYASRRQKKNFIGELEDAAGVWRDSEHEVACIAMQYFQQISSSRHPTSDEIEDVLGTVICKVDQHMNAELTKEFTTDEGLRRYSLASGQEINMEKSTVIFSRGVREQVVEEVKEVLGVVVVDKHEKYLGLPTCLGRSKSEVALKLSSSDLGIFVALLWSIWGHHNNVVHGKKVSEPPEIIGYTKDLLS